MLVTVEELKGLEKRSEVKIAYCDIIADYTDEEENKRTRILYNRKNDRYYYHQMKDGKIVQCFEMMLTRKPFGEFYVFNFTLDNVHLYEVNSRNPANIEIKKLDEDMINEGMACEFEGMKVEFESENTLKFNGKSVPIVNDWGYTYKLLKTKIRAQGGAKGLFRFLENIAATENFKLSEEDVKIGSFVLTSFEKSHWRKFKMMYG